MHADHFTSGRGAPARLRARIAPTVMFAVQSPLAEKTPRSAGAAREFPR